MRFLAIVAVLALIAVVAYLLAKGGERVVEYRRNGSQRKQLQAALTNLAIAERGLRAIANGSGAPVLEAQDTLDQINSNYIKELNQ